MGITASAGFNEGVTPLGLHLTRHQHCSKRYLLHLIHRQSLPYMNACSIGTDSGKFLLAVIGLQSVENSFHLIT